ncbi:hypothetical protein Vadar_007318 [Vaccinium darrowii]|uniref:Uncharacterized protein n=1 Tax=Vaccinium darrowii TaxID=229202 RepID=A0ACB7XPT3_9ERIC|nr:hypothetical protein Vadar_007318 [Vaccinium darrowii]
MSWIPHKFYARVYGKLFPVAYRYSISFEFPIFMGLQAATRLQEAGIASNRRNEHAIGRVIQGSVECQDHLMVNALDFSWTDSDIMPPSLIGNEMVENSIIQGLCCNFWQKKALLGAFDKSANDEHERSILTMLKQQCGLKGGDGALSAISRPPLFIWIKTLDPALN